MSVHGVRGVAKCWGKILASRISCKLNADAKLDQLARMDKSDDLPIQVDEPTVGARFRHRSGGAKLA